MVGNSCSTIKKALVLVFMPSYFNTAPSRESVIFCHPFGIHRRRYIFGPADALSVAGNVKHHPEPRSGDKIIAVGTRHRPNREAVAGS
ncbi:hypothetical protein DCC62_03250 [candidate division KSB1 bacterium]|nr:MAG: hypothetical protein DCC62_03250 [candidate division KSB1 bacterium]